MTIEEKAKAYDEAKLRMSKAFNDNRCTIGFINEIFPELKESEDERIRKDLIEFIERNKKPNAPVPSDPCLDKWISWLTPDHARAVAKIAVEEYRDNLWHDPDESPEIECKILWEGENFLGKLLSSEWKPKIDVFGRKERWCYLADILPHREGVNRPYCVTDYTNGYEEGYDKAKKEVIDSVCFHLEMHLPEHLDYNGIVVERKDFIDDFKKTMEE